MKLLVLLLIFTFYIHAEPIKTLHISAWPSNTEIFINDVQPDISKNPDFTTPAKIHIPLSQEYISLTFFQPYFKDSTIQVKIPEFQDSYLMVILDKESDPEEIHYQERQLKKRKQRTIGKGMMFGSILPFGIAGFTLLKNHLENREAEKIEEKLNEHKKKKKKTNSLKQDFKKHQDKSKNYQTATYWLSSVGLALLGIGFYLQF